MANAGRPPRVSELPGSGRLVAAPTPAEKAEFDNLPLGGTYNVSMMNSDRLDLDPPPRRSPRLFADMGQVPHSRPTSSLLRRKPTKSKMDRLRRDAAIYLAIRGGMSQRMAAKVFGMSKSGIGHAYRRISRLKSPA